jgi:hypothetical protein
MRWNQRCPDTLNLNEFWDDFLLIPAGQNFWISLALGDMRRNLCKQTDLSFVEMTKNKCLSLAEEKNPY